MRDLHTVLVMLSHMCLIVPLLNSVEAVCVGAVVIIFVQLQQFWHYGYYHVQELYKNVDEITATIFLKRHPRGKKSVNMAASG